MVQAAVVQEATAAAAKEATAAAVKEAAAAHVQAAGGRSYGKTRTLARSRGADVPSKRRPWP